MQYIEEAENKTKKNAKIYREVYKQTDLASVVVTNGNICKKGILA